MAKCFLSLPTLYALSSEFAIILTGLLNPPSEKRVRKGCIAVNVSKDFQGISNENNPRLRIFQENTYLKVEDMARARLSQE